VFPDKNCEICGTTFTPRRKADRTCSLDCQIQHRRKLSRASSARAYRPRAPRPDVICEGCKASVPTPKTGPKPKWCNTCRATKEDERARKRVAVRRCHKCQTPVPGAERKPGVVVCDRCRVDPRKHREAHEFRRRLRKYGIDQERYEQMLADQAGRCPGCGTTDPGVKGWCIDHCHATGRVRALLCMRCNTMLGLANEDPAILRALADLAEQLQIDRDKDMV
jgi:hypothetical protein